MKNSRGIPAPAGFTLIESMIAMFFLAFMVAEMANLTTYASRNTNLSQRTTRANTLADNAVERGRNTAYNSLQNPTGGETCAVSGFVATCTSTVPISTSVNFTVVRTITPRDAAGAPIALASSNLSDLDVTVSYTDARNNAQTLRVSSIISRY